MLNIKSLGMNYRKKGKKVEAIEDVSAQINNGEFIVFLGPTGCGKTTLLKNIAGLLSPSKGNISLNNVLISKPNKKIGLIPQDSGLFPWLNVKNNIGFGLELNNSLSKEEKKKMINYYLNITGLKEFENDYPKNLSGGMKQKVALARTLINNPEIILMDGPFSALDTQTREKMQEFLVSLWQKEQKTIVFVTHDISEAIFLADKVYVLSKRPGTIKETFKINFSRPRKILIKDSQSFLDLKRRISDVLK